MKKKQFNFFPPISKKQSSLWAICYVGLKLLPWYLCYNQPKKIKLLGQPAGREGLLSGFRSSLRSSLLLPLRPFGPVGCRRGFNLFFVWYYKTNQGLNFCSQNYPRNPWNQQKYQWNKVKKKNALFPIKNG